MAKLSVDLAPAGYQPLSSRTKCKHFSYGIVIIGKPFLSLAATGEVVLQGREQGEVLDDEITCQGPDEDIWGAILRLGSDKAVVGVYDARLIALDYFRDFWHLDGFLFFSFFFFLIVLVTLGI